MTAETKIYPDCDATVLSTSQPNRMGTTGKMRDALKSISVQCGNVIYNCEQRASNNEVHLSSWKSVKEYADAALAATPAILEAEAHKRYPQQGGTHRQAFIDGAQWAATPAVGGEALDRAAFQLFLLDNNASRWPSVNQDHYRKEAKSILDAASFAAQPASPLRGRVTDEMLKSHMKALNEWVEPFPAEYEEGTMISCEMTQQNADEINAMTRTELRKGYEAAFASPPEQPAADPVTGREWQGMITKIAAECHRAKWQFDLSEDYQPSKSAARALILQAFHELHRIGDIAMKYRDALSPAAPNKETT